MGRVKGLNNSQDGCHWCMVLSRTEVYTHIIRNWDKNWVQLTASLTVQQESSLIWVPEMLIEDIDCGKAWIVLWWWEVSRERGSRVIWQSSATLSLNR